MGRYFDFSLSDKQQKSELIDSITDLITDINLFILKMKMHSTRIIFYQKSLGISLLQNLSKSWVTENLESIINSYIRKWLEIPISLTLNGANLTQNRLGLKIWISSVKIAQYQTGFARH